MIIVKLNGGLGNQLFQYALGRHLAEINQVPLKLDISWFDKGIRNYELNYFRIKAGLATQEDNVSVTKMTTRWRHRIDRNITQKLLPYYLKNHVQEKNTGFDLNILKVGDNAYLTGYWQSEKYFKPIESVLRSELLFREPMDEKNLTLVQKIQHVNAVSLHVRRGDYVSNPEYRQMFGTCDLDYYKKAVALISTKVSDPHFFVFSDDPGWVKENIKVNAPTTFVIHNQGTESYRDMQLMSLCKHNIIANSTFSWWGAWLNANPGRIVITPEKWFSDDNFCSQDLVPSGWVTM